MRRCIPAGYAGTALCGPRSVEQVGAGRTMLDFTSPFKLRPETRLSVQSTVSLALPPSRGRSRGGGARKRRGGSLEGGRWRVFAA